MLTKEKEEITWHSMLHDLVKTEGMDPWDIDISQLAKLYIDTVKELKEHDFRVSGKVLLAAAILLKLKSHRLVDEELGEFDRLLKGEDEELPDELLFDEDDEWAQEREDLKEAQLIPRTPQPRKRKVSIYDLVAALEQALEVKKRRVWNAAPPQNFEPPKKSRDITEIIKDVYGKIRSFFSTEEQKKMTFSQLIPSQSKDDKVTTFIPLLHLSQQRKIDLEQEEPFGEIGISLYTKKVEEETEGESA